MRIKVSDNTGVPIVTTSSDKSKDYVYLVRFVGGIIPWLSQKINLTNLQTLIGGGSATKFTDLSDVPASYAGAAGKLPKVNDLETGLDFSTITSGDIASTIAASHLRQHSIFSTEDHTNIEGIYFDATIGTGGDYIDVVPAYAAGKRRMKFVSDVNLTANFNPIEFLIIDTNGFKLIRGVNVPIFNENTYFSGVFEGTLNITNDRTKLINVTVLGAIYLTANYCVLSKVKCSNIIDVSGDGNKIDFCEVAGLFRLLSGSEKNVGTGNAFTGSFTNSSGNVTNEIFGNENANNSTNNTQEFQNDVYLKKAPLPATPAIVEESSTGLLSATKILISAYIINAIIISYLENITFWDVNGNYIGTAITGTYQGQKHYNADYFFEFVADNAPIRLIRG